MSMENSSLHELISRSSKIAFEAGKTAEKNRAIRILKSLPKEFSHNDYVLRAVAKAIAELKS